MGDPVSNSDPTHPDRESDSSGAVILQRQRWMHDFWCDAIVTFEPRSLPQVTTGLAYVCRAKVANYEAKSDDFTMPDMAFDYLFRYIMREISFGRLIRLDSGEWRIVH